ncbi:NACHT domain-containing protein [Streptomyces sp. NPDC001941]|uniref:NACHT domain-containing protein n=1 Tax=Streptomyces sp. NPDC001941 TaxID=3154659 RepID=UPI0033314C26
MTGIEAVLVRLAGTVAGALAKSLVTPRSGAGLVPSPLRPLPRPAGPERLARVLGERLAAGYGDLPDHEREAAALAVRDSFARAGALDTDRLFALDLEPARLRDELRAPDAGLSGRTLQLYDELLLLCCAHLLEQATAHPSFATRAAVEQTRAAARTRDAVAALAVRPPEALALEFEQRYADFLAETHGRLELFGLTLGRSGHQEWPLDTAYISLAVSGDPAAPGPGGFGPAGGSPVAVKAEQALASSGRLVLRGPAGSGKTTLLQWLALNTARRTFTGELADWNRRVPFVLRLRAFTAADALPQPDEFLRAGGVPMGGSAPAGWVEGLLTEGRAVVLVDGVDEVPARLRRRTESWLRALVTAYPRARYVVTTRPAAVPEDWLARQGFTAHSLLPMDRADIRSFVAHWHEAARTECASPGELEQLGVYEASLRRAVGSRRDLARLATNPLMCALLCALNRDRRMQLPRARKELYDAALDMLLVRRDTERDIVGVEGVDLTREEQTALLQRLAYWLIRNGLAEADRTDVVELLDGWLTAMSQVEAGAEEVFAHLLIRSGLLREPAPGAVGFVHRTFQDYLGARAAVEARDFGVLLRQAHDDAWDDVVQMAVGHARADERARLLTDLLDRADAEEEHRHRLVLLAAASLEHAPELDPGVRERVQERTRDLLPPRSRRAAEELAKVGELVLELLPGSGEGLDEYEAAAVVMTARLIGGDGGFEVVARLREDERFPVRVQIAEGWGAFDTAAYAREVLSVSSWTGHMLPVETDAQLAALRDLPSVHSVNLKGDHPDLSVLHALDDLRRLFLFQNRAADLSPLRRFAGLDELWLSGCLELRDLSPLRGSSLSFMSLSQVRDDLSLDPLREMPRLLRLSLTQPMGLTCLEELPVGEQLTGLTLHETASRVRLDGIERWPGLVSLQISGPARLRQLAGMPHAERITQLFLSNLEEADLPLLASFPRLEELYLQRCALPPGLGLVPELPALRTLYLWGCTSGSGPVDLRPLAERDQLAISADDSTPLTGHERIPPERLRIARAF